MNIEKVKNYNQKMLAVASTLIAILAFIGIVAVVAGTIGDLLPDRSQPDNVLVADQKTGDPKGRIMRQQIVSYGSPDLIDTLNLVYLVKVNAKTLDRPEVLEEPSLQLYDSWDNFKRRSWIQVDGSFTNLLLYDHLKNKSEKIVNSRIFGHDLSVRYFDDDILCVFLAAEQDTDKDREINADDANALYVFTLRDRNPRKISLEGSSAVSYLFVENTKDILVTFGYDRNLDGRFEPGLEPSFLMRYDFTTGRLTKMLDEQTELDLQKILDRI